MASRAARFSTISRPVGSGSSSARCISSVPLQCASCSRPFSIRASGHASILPKKNHHSSLARRSPRCSNGSTGKPHCSAIRAAFSTAARMAGCTGTSQNCGNSPMRSPLKSGWRSGTGAENGSWLS